MGDKMKKVFISHPLNGDFEGNRKKANIICKYIIRQGYLPISPLHSFLFIDEETPELRSEIMSVCYRLIDISDEVWVYGDSEGCRLEKQYAEKVGKKIVILYKRNRDKR